MGLEGFNAAEQTSKKEVKKWNLEDIQKLNESRDKINATLNLARKVEEQERAEKLKTFESEQALDVETAVDYANDVKNNPVALGNKIVERVRKPADLKNYNDNLMAEASARFNMSSFDTFS